MVFNTKETCIIAEVGTAHSGSLEKAYQLIDAACQAGADCIKFQWVYADEILHPNTGYVQLPSGNIRLYDRFKSLEEPISFYKALIKYVHNKNKKFICSPFGIRSLRELISLNPDAIKIASPELNHFPMLEELVKLEMKRTQNKRIPVIFSTGVSKLEDIQKAYSILKVLDKSSETDVFPPLSLLHCITAYPAPESEYNLSLIPILSDQFSLPIGVSDHSLNPLLVPSVTVAMGGRLIEKHITLSKETNGLDDPVALTPFEFKQMTQAVHSLETLPLDFRLDELFELFGEQVITEIIGNGKKELAKSEEANYLRTNRSIHYMTSLKAGRRIHKKDIGILRTEKVLTPGISPEFYQQVIGKKLKIDVTAGSGLLLEHLE